VVTVLDGAYSVVQAVYFDVVAPLLGLETELTPVFVSTNLANVVFQGDRPATQRLTKNLDGGVLTFEYTAYSNRFLLVGKMDDGAVGQVPYGLQLPLQNADTIELKVAKYDAGSKKIQLMPPAPQDMFLPQVFRIMAGVDMKGTFQVNGKRATDQDSNYYWVQYVTVSQQVTKQGVLDKSQSTDGMWELDKPVDNTDPKMPNRYAKQDKNADHQITDSPGSGVDDPITSSMFDRTTSKVTFNLMDKPLSILQTLKMVDTAFQRITAIKFEYQTYLVKTGVKDPVGYVTWGFTYIRSGDGITLMLSAVEWQLGQDRNVWGKAM
jgi:hypothetical protein